MDYDIIPIAMTRVAWVDYIKFVNEHFGYSPTRGLDDCTISINEPQSFLATLDLDNQPNTQLSECSESWEHVHFSFMAKLPKSFILPFYQAAPKYKMKMYKVPDNDDDYVIIMTGSMLDWHNTIISGCREKVKFKIRSVYNHIMQYFEQAGFKLIWSKYEKQLLPDGSFILKHRR